MLPPIVVAGTGSIGLRHLRTIAAKSPGSALAMPLRPERRPELEAEGFRVVTSFADAKRSGAVAAIIATDTARHVADATEALALGMPTLIEKPIGATAAETQVLAPHAERVCVAYCLRFDAGLALFRQHLPRIGRVFSVRIACQSHLPDWRPKDDHRRGYAARAADGGVLRDLSHEVDYAALVFGKPTHVSALITGGERLEIASDAGADLLWRAPGDVVVSMRLDYLTRLAHRSMTAFGEHGQVRWDAIARRLEVAVGTEVPEIQSYEQSRDELMTAQLDAFRAFVDGAPAPLLATFEEGVFAAALADAARASDGQKTAITTIPVSA